jgi:hypothetical protein
VSEKGLSLHVESDAGPVFPNGFKTNCLVRAYERLLAQPCPGDRRGRTFGKMIEAATTH